MDLFANDLKPIHQMSDLATTNNPPTHLHYLAGQPVDEARYIRDSKWNSTRKFPFGEDALTSASYTEEDHFASYRGAGDGVAIDYARHRSYAPTLGTFTSPDPYEGSATGLGSTSFTYDPRNLESCAFSWRFPRSARAQAARIPTPAKR
jgi:hypothetical protein